MAKILENEKEFAALIDAVVEFCSESKSMAFPAAVEEQCKAYKKEGYLTLVELDADGCVDAYITGIPVSHTKTFFITQGFSAGGKAVSSKLMELLEALLGANFIRIEFITTLPIRVFTGYGFEQRASIMAKELKNELSDGAVGVPEADSKAPIIHRV